MIMSYKSIFSNTINRQQTGGITMTELSRFQKDVEQLVSKGNNVAGMKARKATLELRSLLKEFRKMSVEVAK